MAQNFKLETDSDGIALITWDEPGRSMNVIDVAVIQELSDLLEKTSADANIKGVVITSGKDTFCAGADLALLNTMQATYLDFVKSQGPEAAAKKLFEESRKLAALSADRDLRQAMGRRAQRHRAWRRVRIGARLPSPCRLRQRQDAPGSAGDQDRPVSRGGWDNAALAHDVAGRRTAI